MTSPTFCALLAVAIAVVACPQLLADPVPDLELVASRIRASLCAHPPKPEEVRKQVAALKPDGTWPDVRYDSQQRGGWHVIEHLTRVTQLAVAYTAPESPLHGDAAVLAAADRALDWWLVTNLARPKWAANWWYNDIATPRALGDIGILLDGHLQPATALRLRERLAWAKPGMTGQNWVWLSGVVLREAILTRDEPKAAEMFRNIFREIRVGREEGLQPDMSFHQHGAQQQFGNYGLAFASDSLDYLRLAAGTVWAPPAEQLGLVRDYVLEGQVWHLWRGQYDLNACGRQIVNDAGKARAVERILTHMGEVDPGHAAAYATALAGIAGESREPGPLGSRAYYCSDMLSYRTPGWMLSVQLTSARTIPNELVNSENEQGLYVGLGSAFLYRTGREYADLPHVWDWRRIPGTVAPLAGGPIKPGELRNGSPWAGVAGSRTGSAAAMHFVPKAKGHPSWESHCCFACFPRGYVQLSQVTDNPSAGDAHPVSSVAQTLLTGEVVWLPLGGEAQLLTHGTHSFTGPGAVWHDEVAYVFPTAETILVQTGPRTDSWFASYHKPEDAKMKALVTHAVFGLAVDHGAHAARPAAACIVLPNTPRADLAARLADPGLTIVANDDRVQAARDGDGRLVAACYAVPAPGLLPLTPDQPCLWLVADGSLTATDPTQHLSTLTFHAGERKLKLPLATGDHAGQAATVAYP